MLNKPSHMSSLVVGAMLGGIAVGAFDRCGEEESEPVLTVETDSETGAFEEETVPLPEVFCESDDTLTQQGFAMRPRPFCVHEETSRLYADQRRFDSLSSSEQDQMVNEALTTFRAEMRKCMRKSKGKKNLELGSGYRIDPGFSAIMTFNCGGDDEESIDYELTEGFHGFVSDDGEAVVLEDATTIVRYWAYQIVTLSEFIDTYYVDADMDRFVVTQRIDVRDTMSDADFVHERRFTYKTREEYEVAMGIFEVGDYEGTPVPVQERGPSELHALQGIVIDAGEQFYSNESVELHPTYACSY